MDLHDFIHQSLRQIAMAIRDTNQSFVDEKVDSRANPPSIQNRQVTSNCHEYFPHTQLIDFDVALTVSETSDVTSEKKGGLGISVMSASVGSQKSTEQANSSVTRIKFTIPLKLPAAPA